MFRQADCGCPHPRHGSLGKRRHERRGLVFFVLRGGQSQCRFRVVRRKPCLPSEQSESGERALRALRPASAQAAFYLFTAASATTKIRRRPTLHYRKQAPTQTAAAPRLRAEFYELRRQRINIFRLLFLSPCAIFVRFANRNTPTL